MKLCLARAVLSEAFLTCVWHERAVGSRSVPTGSKQGGYPHCVCACVLCVCVCVCVCVCARARSRARARVCRALTFNLDAHARPGSLRRRETVAYAPWPLENRPIANDIIGIAYSSQPQARGRRHPVGFHAQHSTRELTDDMGAQRRSSWVAQLHRSRVGVRFKHLAVPPGWRWLRD